MIEIESTGVPIKAWVEGVPVEDEARAQLQRVARLPVVWPHLAVMPDVHWGIGATVGSVVSTKGAIIPAAVGVDLGCGMSCACTNLRAKDLPDSLAHVRSAIEAAVPHGRTNNGGSGDRGAWGDVPAGVDLAWGAQKAAYDEMCARHPKMRAHNTVGHLGTLGTGNHFVEVCLDTDDRVWVMLHSGSRGVGNRVGSYFIELAKEDMLAAHGDLPEDADLAYLDEGTEHFDDYVRAVSWAQRFARINREIMMGAAIHALRSAIGRPDVRVVAEVVDCHHNYVQRESHFGQDLWVTRKGAVSARAGEFGIIPGCFAAGTRLLMADGTYKNIEDVRVGDSVISSSGEPSKVTDTFARGAMRVWRYRGNNFHADTVVTPDHLHFIGDMSSSNYQTQGRVKVLSRPNRDGTSKYTWCPLNELPGSFTFLLPRKIDFASMPKTFDVAHEGRRLVPSYALGYSFGAFLGNGTSRYVAKDGGQISWSRDATKPEIVDKIAAQTHEAFQIETKIYSDGSVKLCVVHSASLARLFETFGKRTRKELPNIFWAHQPDYVRGLYDGLIDTDGHTIDGVDKFTNTSTALIEQFGILHYLLFGYFPSISRREPTAGGLPNVADGDCQPGYRAAALKNSAAVLTPDYQLVARLTHTEGTGEVVDTFDIEVDNLDHSFVANNVIVHNSMGARSFIVRGRGNAEALHSCSHGAGRSMSRGAAKKKFTLADHAAATAGIECRKDEGVIDETPGAYKSIDAVMTAQQDLVEVVATLRQVLCVKG